MDKNIQLIEILSSIQAEWEPAAGIIFMVENSYLSKDQVDLLLNSLNQLISEVKGKIDELAMQKLSLLMHKIGEMEKQDKGSKYENENALDDVNNFY